MKALHLSLPTARGLELPPKCETWMQDSDEYQQMRETMMSWWKTVLKSSDHDHDHKVCLDEAILSVDRLADSADVIGTANAMFDAIDEKTARSARTSTSTW